MTNYSKTMAESLMEVRKIEEATMKDSQIAQLKKAYEPMRGKKISTGNAQKLSKMMGKFTDNRQLMIQLVKADIPFVSSFAITQLISKHNMKGAEINKFKKEEMEFWESLEEHKGDEPHEHPHDEDKLDEVQKVARQLKDPKKEVMLVKKNKVIVVDRKDEKEYLSKGWQLAEEVELDEVAARGKKFDDSKIGVGTPVEIKDKSGKVHKGRVVKVNRKDDKVSISIDDGGTIIAPRSKVSVVREEDELDEAMQGHALIVNNKIVARGSKKNMISIAKKEHGGLKRDKVSVAFTGKEVGDVWEEVDLDEAKYDLYHKDFSTAMQYAYKMAKKNYGITIDSKEIDDKVATGPRKPSEGKTNKYRLKGDKGAVQIQVYNKGGSKPFELNMYKEEVELEEGKMKELHMYIQQGKSAKEIAKIMKLDVKTIQSLMAGYKESYEIGTNEYRNYLEKLTPGEETQEASASARAGADAARHMRRGKKEVDPADVDIDASPEDVKGASKNIIMQMRKVVSMRGNFPIEFLDKKKVKISVKIAQAVQDKYNSFKKSTDKEKFQTKVAKSYKGMLTALKEEVKETILDKINRKLKERKNG